MAEAHSSLGGVFLLCLCSVLVGCAEDGQRRSVHQQATRAAKFVVQATEFDVGEVWRGQELVVETDVVNIGDRSFGVDDLRPSCACWRISLQPTTVAPGHSGKLFLEFDTRASGFRLQGGRQEFRLALAGQPMSLSLLGDLLDVFPSSGWALDMGDVARGGTVRREITLEKSAAIGAIRLTRAYGAGPGVEVSVLEECDEELRLGVDLDGSDAEGEERSVILEYAERVLRFPVRATVAPRIVASESLITFRGAEEGAQELIWITCQSGPVCDVRLDRVEEQLRARPPVVASLRPLDAGHQFELRLSLSDTIEEGPPYYRGAVVLQTDDPVEREIRIRYQGYRDE